MKRFLCCRTLASKKNANICNGQNVLQSALIFVSIWSRSMKIFSCIDQSIQNAKKGVFYNRIIFKCMYVIIKQICTFFYQITYSSFRFGTSERIDGNILTVDSAFTEDNDSFHPSSSFQSCQVPNPPLSSNSGHPPPSLSSYYHILTDIQEQVSKMCTISFFYLISHKT